MMKRMTAALLALAIMMACAGLAEECEGWAVANVDTQMRKAPDSRSEVLLEIVQGTELEYGGFTKYDADHTPWYGVSWQDVTGWIPGDDAELKWSTLY